MKVLFLLSTIAWVVCCAGLSEQDGSHSCDRPDVRLVTFSNGVETTKYAAYSAHVNKAYAQRHGKPESAKGASV